MAAELGRSFSLRQNTLPLPRPGAPTAALPAPPDNVSEGSSDAGSPTLPTSPPALPKPSVSSSTRGRPHSRHQANTLGSSMKAAARSYFPADQASTRPLRPSREDYDDSSPPVDSNAFRGVVDYNASRHPDAVRPSLPAAAVAGQGPTWSSRPPRAYLNHPAFEDLGLPSKPYVEDTKSPQEYCTHVDTSRRVQLYDEEQGYGYGTGGLAGPTGLVLNHPSRDPALTGGGGAGSVAGAGQIDWKNLSREERNEVLRIPWTRWMDSDFKNHFVASVGEFVGTTMFLFFAFAGTEVANIQGRVSGNPPDTFNLTVLLYVSLAFGFSLTVNAWIFFRISGGLFNPAVTLAMFLVRSIGAVRAVCLFLSQMCGAIVASVMTRYMFPEPFSVLRTKLDPGVSLTRGVFIEAVLTAELVFAIFMLAREKHRATFMAPVGIGLALFISDLVGAHYTGASLNPARSFGPCVVSTFFESEHWIYWVGPLMGALLAVVFYQFIKMLEYEMANPGADGDPESDPTINPEKRAEIILARQKRSGNRRRGLAGASSESSQ